MTIILSLLITALAAMGLAVATVRRPLIASPLAGAASGVLLVEAAALWLLAWDVAAAASAACGIAACVWGVRLALAYADRLRAEEDAAGGYTAGGEWPPYEVTEGRQDLDPDSSAHVRHEIAVDNILGGAR